MVQQVGDVQDIEYQRNLTAAILQIEEILSDVLVKLVLLRSQVRVALSKLASMLTGILVVLNPILELKLVGL